MSGNSAWGFEASEKMTPTKVRPNDARIFMVRWDFSDVKSGQKVPPIEYSFIIGLGEWSLWEQLDEYAAPGCAEVRVVRGRDYGQIQFDGTMSEEGKMVFEFRQGMTEGLNALWAACRPLDWDEGEEFRALYGRLSKRGVTLGEQPL